MERVVLFPMNGHGEDIVIVLEDGCRTISLVHVQIDDHGAPNPTRPFQCLNGDAHVIEDTKPFTMTRKCVVRPAGEIGRQPVFQRHVSRIHGALHGVA